MSKRKHDINVGGAADGNRYGFDFEEASRNDNAIRHFANSNTNGGGTTFNTVERNARKRPRSDIVEENVYEFGKASNVNDDQALGVAMSNADDEIDHTEIDNTEIEHTEIDDGIDGGIDDGIDDVPMPEIDNEIDDNEAFSMSKANVEIDNTDEIDGNYTDDEIDNFIATSTEASFSPITELDSFQTVSPGEKDSDKRNDDNSDEDVVESDKNGSGDNTDDHEENDDGNVDFEDAPNDKADSVDIVQEADNEDFANDDASLDLEKFVMSNRGNQAARDLAKPYCETILHHARLCNEIEDHSSDLHLQNHLVPYPITNNAAVYFRKDKFGITSRFRHRIEKDTQKNASFTKEDYQMVLDFDNITNELNNHWESVYTELTTVMMTDESLRPSHRRIFQALILNEGDKLGPKRSIMLQMLECALQEEHNFDAPAEFLMFDDDVEDRFYMQVQMDAMKVIQALGFLERYAARREEFFLWAVSSWDTGASGDCYSSEIMTLIAILGKTRKGNWLNTIPVAAILNAVTRDQIFCKAYSSQKRETGRQRMLGVFDRLFGDPDRPGIVFADTNDVVFADDPDSQWNSIHEFIRHHWGDNLDLVLNLRDEIYVYKHKHNPHAILVYRPLCLASSSLKVPMESRVERGLTAAILCNVQRFGNGLEFLSPTVEWGNIVQAMIAFQICSKGFLHGGYRQSAAFFRHFCRLDESEAPLTKNGLGKIEGAVPRYLRDYGRSEHARRTDDCKVVRRARRRICNHPDLKGRCQSADDAREVIGPILDDVVNNLLYMADSPYAIKDRLDSLKKQFKEDSFIPTSIDEYWRTRRQNSGNPEAHNTSNEQIDTTNDACDKWIDNFAPKGNGQTQEGPQEGPSFWIELGRGRIDKKHIDEAINNVKHRKSTEDWSFKEGDDFRNDSCKDFFDGGLVYRGLVERLNKRNRKGKTLHSRATRYSEYGLKQEQCVGTFDRQKFYTLVRIRFNNKSKVRTNRNGNAKPRARAESVPNSTITDAPPPPRPRRPSSHNRNSNAKPRARAKTTTASAPISTIADAPPRPRRSSQGNAKPRARAKTTTASAPNSTVTDAPPPPRPRRPSSQGNAKLGAQDSSSAERATASVANSTIANLEQEHSNLPKLDPKLEIHIATLKRYFKQHKKYPSGSKGRIEERRAISWAKNYKSRFANNKVKGNDPVVIRLKAIGYIDYEPSEHIESGNKGWNDTKRNRLWDEQCDALELFLSQPELGGFGALRKRNKNLDPKYTSLTRWIETNKPKYKKQEWIPGDQQENLRRLKRLQNINFPHS